MRQLNLPKKPVAWGQIGISLLLILLSVVFAFGSIVSIDLSNSTLRKTVNEGLASMAETVEGAATMQIPEHIDVTTSKIVKAVSIFSKIISVAIKEAKASGSTLSDSEKQKLEQAENDLAEMIKSEEGREAIVMTIALIGQVADFGSTADTSTDSAAEDASSETATTTKESSSAVLVIAAILRAIVLFYLCVFIVLFPFVLLLTLVINLLKVLPHLKDPQKSTAKISNILNTCLSLSVVTSLLLTVLPGMEWGSGLKGLFVLSIVNLAVNVCATRVRSYTSRDLAYANLAQGVALGELIGFFLFFFNALKVGVLQGYLSALGAHLETVFKQANTINSAIRLHNQAVEWTKTGTKFEEFTPGSGYVADFLLVFLFAVLVLTVCSKAIQAISAHLGFTAGKKDKANDALSSGIMALVACILPFVATKLQNAKSYSISELELDKLTIHEETLGAIYSMPAATKSALVAMIVGAVIMIAAGVAFIVLKQKFCPNITTAEEFVILQGSAPAANENGETAETPAEENAETPAEENAEAPAEENAEAPAEENETKPEE